MNINKPLIGTCLLVASLFHGPVLAETGSSTDTLKAQRELFLKAEYAARNPRSSGYKRLMKKIKDYPLAPYAEVKALKRYPYMSNREKIDKFLNTYQGSPLDWPLREKWLRYLFRKEHYQVYREYMVENAPTEFQCMDLVAALKLGVKFSDIQTKVGNYWQVGKSQPKACDPLFDQWAEKGLRTEDVILTRLSLAADGGNHTLIPYLKSLLPKNKRYLADLWYRVRRDPSYVSRPSRFPNTFPELEAKIAEYGFNRLIWRDKKLALRGWKKAVTHFAFSEEQLGSIAERFAIRLAVMNAKEADEWLKKIPRSQFTEDMFQWQLTHKLRESDWSQTMDFLSSAGKEFSQSLPFKYWYARGLEELGSAEEASSRYQDISKERHYYGFMASGQLGKYPSMSDKPVQVSPEQLLAISEMPATKRAYELFKLERFTQARREFNFLMDQLTAEQKQIAAVIADSWNWHDQAILTFARAEYRNDVARRFPMAFSDEFHKQAKKQNIEPAWAFAITRRESAFMIDANSHVGAKGLMQVMPDTAQYLQKKKLKGRQLLEPSLNIQLGTNYLRYLLDKLEGNHVLATAAYNAGWPRVKNWVPNGNGLAADVWIETIPFKETRDYVKSVMAYKQIYLTLMGKKENLFKQLSEMVIKRS